MADKKQSWSKLADSFEFDPDHDASEEEQKQFVETSRQEELAKAAKAPSLDKYMNVGLTTKILARLGFKGAVEKVQLYHEAKNERIEKEKATREAANATKQAAESQTREAVSNEQALNSYTESTLHDREVAGTSEGQAWMAQYLKAGQEAVKKLEANEEEFKAQVEAQGLAMERMLSMKKQDELETTRQAEVAERKAAEQEAEQVEPRFLQSMQESADNTSHVLQESMVEGDPGYDPKLESTTKSDISEVTDGVESFLESKAGTKLEETNPELVAALKVAAYEAEELIEDIDETAAQTEAVKKLLSAEEITKQTAAEMSAAITKLDRLEGRIKKMDTLLNAPEGIIDEIDSIKRPGKDVKQLKESLSNAAARLVKLEEISAFKKQLEEKLPEAIAYVASKVEVGELTEQTPEEKTPYQIKETMNEVRETLEQDSASINELVEQGEKLLESEENKSIIVLVPMAMNRIREISNQGREIKRQVKVTEAYMKVITDSLESGDINKDTVVELSQVAARVSEYEQMIRELNQELNQELSASDLLDKIKDPGELTEQYQDTLEQTKNETGQTDELTKRKQRLSEIIGQTITLLAEQAGQDEDKMAWTRKLVDWSKEVQQPVEAEVFVDDDELDEQLMAEINNEIKQETLMKELIRDLPSQRAEKTDEDIEIDEAELEAMETVAQEKYEFGDRVFVETLGLKLGGEVKAYTKDGKVEVRFDDGQRQVFEENQLKPEPAGERPAAEKKPVRLLSKEEQVAGVEGTDLDEPYHAAPDAGDVPTTIKRRKKIKPEDIDKQMTA